MSLWHKHPGVRSGEDLTIGERAADIVRDNMGSWGFVFAFLVIMFAWMVGNGSHGFDPYPFILLNLALSTMAGIQGAILLIAAKRADQVASELANHDYQINVLALQLIKAIHDLSTDIHQTVVPAAAEVHEGDGGYV